MYEVGEFVRLNTHDEWDGLYGMISGISNGIITVFCVLMPCWEYYVKINDVDDVVEVIEL